MAKAVALDDVDNGIEALVALALEAQLQEACTAAEAATARARLQAQVAPLPDLLTHAHNLILEALEEGLTPILDAALGLDDE